ncbi:TOBE domain-containing protein [Sulfurimonas sp. HSL-3221]|uniref:TOBE domain-containing protein n=1 Tax=Thiomicrolovo sulfuroxydans TaxID=2894755 RepID=UPI001E326429|nr:TOBE domain-containing protein [Sulfurimonas sp. HSL-3221]UFS61850.1 TOBE domain-containing protein [Sulfurimonas sp. HSL-3221]
MNRIEAYITSIERRDNITIVSFDAGGAPMRMMALGLAIPIAVGTRVILGAKASHVALAKKLEGHLSISNRLEAVIETVETGALLCSVTLRVGPARMESIITRDSAETMALHQGDSVTALIKASDLSILEIVEKGET